MCPVDGELFPGSSGPERSSSGPVTEQVSSKGSSLNEPSWGPCPEKRRDPCSRRVSQGAQGNDSSGRKLGCGAQLMEWGC